MEKRTYLVLISLSKANKLTANKILTNLKDICVGPVSPIWFDPAYVGVAVTSEHSAREIWKSAVSGFKEHSDLRDMLIVELGRDWLARKDAAANHWLTTHLGRPLL